jgi:acyl carrier protein
VTKVTDYITTILILHGGYFIMENVKEEIKAIIADIIEVEVEEVLDDAKFIEDLGADSLKALELLATLEKKYQKKIPESGLKRLTTLNNTLQVLEEVI